MFHLHPRPFRTTLPLCSLARITVNYGDGALNAPIATRGKFRSPDPSRRRVTHLPAENPVLQHPVRVIDWSMRGRLQPVSEMLVMAARSRGGALRGDEGYTSTSADRRCAARFRLRKWPRRNRETKSTESSWRASPSAFGLGNQQFELVDPADAAHARSDFRRGRHRHCRPWG